MRFASGVEVETGFTRDRERTLAAVEDLTASGETALYDGILEAVDLLEGRPPEQRNIVLLSDGADTVSGARLADALAAADGRARIFGVALKSPEFSLKPIAALTRRTGGELLQTASSARLSGLFEDLARTLVTGYSVSVDDPAPSASRVEIRVVVQQRSGALEGSATFAFGSPSPPDTPTLSLPELPLPLLLLSVFAATVAGAFLVLEWVRRKRSRVADRVVWYTDEGPEVDADALINAAVLKRAQDVATDLAERAGLITKIEREIDAAGMRWRPGEVLITAPLIGLAAGMLGAVLVAPLFGLVLFVAGITSLWIVIRHRASKRRQAFEKQLPDVLLVMAGALRAGYSLQQAVAAVGQDAKPPAGEDFRRATAEIRLGASLDDALDAVARRVGLTDFDWTVLAIQIQREVGGNLAEILSTISETIRERERIRRQIRTLTAEARLSAIVLGVLPFAMAGFLLVVNREYLTPLITTSMGLMMIGGSIVMMSFGFLWMRKIVRIEV